MQILTQKQEKVLQILKTCIGSTKKAPSLSELQERLRESGMNAKSKRSVVQYLEALEQKGIITRSSEERGIKIVGPKNTEDFIDIPLMGTANAGAALVFAEENIRGFLKISKKLLRSIQNVFALEISGDSMNRAKIENKFIEDGDYVVIDRTVADPRNNDIVLAIVDGCATIKRLKKSMFGEVVLAPDSANPVHQPIYIHESDSFHLNGKVINVLKNPKNI